MLGGVEQGAHLCRKRQRLGSPGLFNEQADKTTIIKGIVRREVYRSAVCALGLCKAAQFLMQQQAEAVNIPSVVRF